MIINPNFYKTVKIAQTAPKSDFNYTITTISGVDYAVINYIDFTNNPNTAIRIPERIEDSGISYPVAFRYNMFTNANTNLGNCNELTIDYKPYIYKNTSSTEHFRYPNQIKYLNLYNLEFYSLGGYTNIYYEMPSFLEELNLSVTILTKIPERLFYNNQSVNIDEIVSNLVGANTITEIEAYAFTNCINLTYGTWNTVDTIGEYAFSGCSALQTISFPIVTSIGNSTFYGCSNLVNVSLPAVVSLTSKNTFDSCVALHELKLENVVTLGNNEGTGTIMFRNCTNLETIDLYETTSLIGYNSSNKLFNNCNNIKHIYLRASSKCSLNVANCLCPTTSLVAIHIPSALLASYQADSNWSAYSSYFVGDL